MDDQPSLTRGFLFADLRGYTAFVEAHDDAAGAALLHTYRAVVRDVIARFSGAEIRTEGDSFYVTFPSASSAVAAALAIVSSAAAASKADPSLPIAVGVGVHAGETQATDEGPVGSAVNIAARLASAAGPGEVLVSETVRGLTRTSGGVRYISRGTRRLKGISEPVPVYVAAPAGTVVQARRDQRLPSRLAIALFGLTGLVLAVVAGIYLVTGTGTGAGSRPTIPGATPTLAAAISPSATPTATASGGPTASVTASPAATNRVEVLSLDYNNRRQALSPGTYKTVDAQPPYEFSVGDGWVFRADDEDPGFTRLELADRPTSALSVIHIVSLQVDTCGLETPVPANTYGSFKEWLRAQPGLTVGEDVARIFGSITAIQLDVAVNEQKACTTVSPPGVMIRQNEADFPSVSCCVSFQLSAGQVARAYVFNLADAPFAAFAVAPTESEADLLWPKAEQVLSTLSSAAH